MPDLHRKASNSAERRCGLLFYLCNSRADPILISAGVESQKPRIIWVFSHPVPTEIYSEIRHRMGWAGVSKHTSTNTGHPRVTHHVKWCLFYQMGMVIAEWHHCIFIVSKRDIMNLNMWPGSCWLCFLTIQCPTDNTGTTSFLSVKENKTTVYFLKQHSTSFMENTEFSLGDIWFSCCRLTEML